MSSSSPRAKGYEAFFGFREPPFSLAPDTRFLFDAASHAAARDQVAHALERREPLVVVSGEIGTGKTLLCRSVVDRLERRTFLSIVHDPMLERDDLLKQMLQDFGVISKDRTRLAPATRHELVHALQEFLLSLVPLHAHAVLVIDEAQHLQPDVLEQLRLISNVHDEAGTLLQIILVGQPALDAVLSRPELRQLKQRVSRHIRLEPLGIAELSQYIDHRLGVAREGVRPHGADTFTPEALSAIWRLSRGTPRIINVLCDRALEAAYEQQARSVDFPLVEGAAAELGMTIAPTPAPTPPPSALAAYPPERTVAAEPPPAASVVWSDHEELPVRFGETAEIEKARPQANRLLVGAAVVIVAGAAAWFAVRGFWRSESSFTAAAPAERQPPPAATPPATPSATAPASPPVTSPVNPPVSPPVNKVPDAAPTTSTPAMPAATPLAAPPVSAGQGQASADVGPFEIVVASFRTMTRASSVAAELTALGQPVRQRTSDGWQQVLAGPFPTREAATAAQERLDRAGYTGTQIVPAPH
jgi:type II secretory pathway predicted ATPase ExeA/cell division protein FtsN